MLFQRKLLNDFRKALRAWIRRDNFLDFLQDWIDIGRVISCCHGCKVNDELSWNRILANEKICVLFEFAGLEVTDQTIFLNDSRKKKTYNDVFFRNNYSELLIDFVNDYLPNVLCLERV